MDKTVNLHARLDCLDKDGKISKRTVMGSVNLRHINIDSMMTMLNNGDELSNLPQPNVGWCNSNKPLSEQILSGASWQVPYHIITRSTDIETDEIACGLKIVVRKNGTNIGKWEYV